MKLHALALMLVAFATPAMAQQQSAPCPDRLEPAGPTDRVRPLIVLVETEPWLMVIGSDSPRFALYSDGLVIYRHGREYRSVRLSDEERRALLASLDVESLACFTGFHGNTAATDQPYHNLFLGRGGSLSLVSVYGAQFDRSAVPQALAAVHARLAAFDHPGAQTWLPERIEVMIWPYEYAPDASIEWPADWPGLDSEHAVRRGDGYSIFVPGAELARLVAFLGTRRERGAVRIGGHKWAAGLRFPFPVERMWMRPGSD
jgi:hypothetical protein